MQFVRFLKEKVGDDCLDNIKLSDVTYTQDDTCCIVTFTYPDSANATPNDGVRNAIQNAVAEYIGGICKVQTKFRKAFADDEVVRAAVVKFLSSNYPNIGYSITKENIQINNLDDGIHVIVSCVAATNAFIEQKKVFGTLENKFKQQFGLHFSFETNITEQSTTLGELFSMEDQLMQNSLQASLNRESSEHKVEMLNKLFGKDITQPVVFVEDLKGDLPSVVVAGKIKFFTEKTYMPKKKPENNATVAEKRFYSFSIEDPTGSINVVHFPTLASGEHVAKLSDGVSVAICGRVENYNDRLSLRAMDVCYCTLSGEGKKKVFRNENPNYLRVLPESYIEKEQLALFGEQAGTSKSDFWKDKSVVVFDLETTGLDNLKESIIEIGAVKVVDGRITETFSTLVNPKKSIPEDATKINHITNEMVADAPIIDEVLPDFYKFTRGSVLSAYNIDFDFSFLRTAANKLRFNFDNEQIDTLVLARAKLRGLHNYKLATVAKALGVSLENAHRALDDTIATAKIFVKLI